MADIKLETTEPDPAATSLSNDAQANQVGDDAVTTQNDVGVTTPVKAERTDTVPADDEIAKDAAVKTKGHTNNGVKKEGDENADEKADVKTESKPQTFQKYGENDPKNKYRTSGLKNRGNVFDPSVLGETDDPAAIRKQVEFYFSDGNLMRDKFLFDQVEGTKNKPISIKTIHSFKRMQRYQPYEAVVKALKDSKVLDVTDDEKVSRKAPLPADFENKTLDEIKKVHEDQSMARSVYVKGFGHEKPSTQFDLEAWFGRFGETNAVRLRRADDQSFKGSVFVEFADEETAKKFLAEDPKPTYNERELLIMSKKAYCDEKVQLIKEGKIQPNTRNEQHRGDKKPRSDDQRDWRERRDEDRKRGFRDDRRGGGRGRGRGGRGRNDRRERPRNDRNEEKRAKEEAESGDKKRPREDGGDDERVAKKEKLET